VSVAFARLGPEDAPRVDHLTLGPGQEKFTAHPASRLGALRAGEEPWAVLWSGDIVGFLIIDRGYAEQYDFAWPGEPGLRSVLIDAGRQGEGIGTAAMAAVRGLMAAEYPEAASLVLTVNCSNPAAKAVYGKAGFGDTGFLFHGGRAGPQHILRMDLRRS
jgi:ribosomal protein S18 acetylase RimI-like enzyme